MEDYISDQRRTMVILVVKRTWKDGRLEFCSSNDNTKKDGRLKFEKKKMDG